MAFRKNGTLATKTRNYQQDSPIPISSVGEKRVNKFLPKFSERVPNGSHFYGWVTHANDPFNFYVRLETGDTKKFKFLHAELQEELPLAKSIDNPYQGLPCAAQINGLWGRAILEKYQPGNDHGEVFFVDTGHRKVVKISCLKKLDDIFTHLPCQAVLCHLGMLVTNPKNINAPWSDASIKFFKNLVEQCFVNIFTVGGYMGGVGNIPPNRESKLYVAMYVGDDELTVNSILFRAGHGQGNNQQEHVWHESKRVSFKSSVIPPEFNMKMVVSQNLPCEEPIASKQEILKKEEPFTSATSSLQSRALNSQPVTKEDNGSKKMPPVSIEVSVCHVIDPGKFYVRHQTFDIYNRYQILINETGPRLNKPWEVATGMNYVVFDEQSKRWFRGKCLKSTQCSTLQSGTIYDFHLIDEGYIVRIPMSAIRELNDELKTIRPMVWECCLDMETPENGWTVPVIEYFKKWIQREKCKMTVYNIRDGVRVVDLAHIQSQPGEMPVESAIESMKTFKHDPPLGNVPKYSQVEDVEPSKVKFVTNLQKVKKGSCLKGHVVHVTDPDEFYIRLEGESVGDFSTMNAQLQEEYNQPDKVEVEMPWKGFPYIVRHQGAWHRALVEDVTSSEEVSVFLVDTGLRLITKAVNIRHIQEKYMAHPVQAVQCKLYGVCSKNASGRWTAESVGHFRQIVDGVEVAVCIEGVILGGVGKSAEDESLLYVVLYNEDDDTSVNTRLTRAGYGVSVRPHDLPSHNRPKRSVPKRCISEPSLQMDDIEQLISGFGNRPANKADTPAAANPNKSFDIDEFFVAPAACYPPVDKEHNIDFLIKKTLDIQSTIVKNGKPNELKAEETAPLEERVKEVEEPSWNGPVCSSAKPVAAALPEKPSEDVTSGKPTAAILPTKAISAGDILAAEVSHLEHSYNLLELDGSVRTYGTMPQESDYIMAVKFLMCPSPQAIYVRPIVYESKYEEMNMELQRTYRTTKVHKIKNIEVGNRCAAFVYGQWIRAVVTEIDAELRCSIMSLDSGQPHQIHYDQIYALISPFEAIPKMALKCSLQGVKPVNGVTYDDIIDKITYSLLQADDVFIVCSQRPKAIPSTLGVSIIFRRQMENDAVLTNLKDWLLK